MATVEEVITALDELIDETKTLGLGPDDRQRYGTAIFNEKLELWTKRAFTKLQQWGFFEESVRFSNAQGDEGLHHHRSAYRYTLLQAHSRVLEALREDLAKHPDFYKEILAHSTALRVEALREDLAKRVNPTPSKPSQTAAKPPPSVDKVFLGHGRDLLWSKVERWLEKDKGMPVEAWESESHTGEQVVQVLERLLDSCTFAVLVVTGEDATASGTLRARQNVIHEIGLFQGKLGFKKVALLEQDGTEGFSNIDGLQTIRFPSQRIEAAFPELERMMKREGLIK